MVVMAREVYFRSRVLLPELWCVQEKSGGLTPQLLSVIKKYACV